MGSLAGLGAEGRPGNVGMGTAGLEQEGKRKTKFMTASRSTHRTTGRENVTNYLPLP